MSQPAADRHASWLELFFDLVVVVAVNQLAHQLHGDGHDGPGGLAIVTFFTLYLAIWLVWTTFTLYSNVTADKVRRRAMFLGMAGIAVMAAAVPAGMDEHATVFAVAYLITSGLGSSSFVRSGQVLLSWSAASRNFGLAPWIVSFWVADPWWKVSLWLFGLLLSVGGSMATSDDEGEEFIARVNERLAQGHPRGISSVVLGKIDPAHLGERLGLFVIIVLGEAMLQLIGAVSDVEDWSPGGGEGWLLILTAAAGFGLLIALWWLNVRYGFAEETRLNPTLILPAHFVAIAAITVIAVGLGSSAIAAAHHLAASTAWLTASGVAAYLLVITALNKHTRRWWLSGLAIILPFAAAALSPLLPAAVVVVILLVVCVLQLWNFSLVRRAKTA
jgi:low temperature requirement protein LtrA